MEFARSFLAEARIESDDFHDLDGGDIEFLGNPFNGLRANETVAVLDFVKKGKHGGATLIVGILSDAFVSRFLESWGDLEWKEVNDTGGNRRMNVLLENSGLWLDIFHIVAVNQTGFGSFALFRSVEADVTQLGSVDRPRAGDFNFRTHLEKNQIEKLDGNLAVALAHHEVERT